MSKANANQNNSKNGVVRGRGRVQQSQAPPIAAGTASSRPETHVQYGDEYPTLETAKSITTPAPIPTRALPANTVELCIQDSSHCLLILLLTRLKQRHRTCFQHNQPHYVR